MEPEPTKQQKAALADWIDELESHLFFDYRGHPDTTEHAVRVVFTLDHGQAKNIRVVKSISPEADAYAVRVMTQAITNMAKATHLQPIDTYPHPYDVEFNLGNDSVYYISLQRKPAPPDWRRIFFQTLYGCVGASFVNPNEKMQPVTVTFVVDEHGTLSELEVTKHSTNLIDEESAINAFKKGFEKVLRKLGPSVSLACASKIEGRVEFERNKITVSKLTDHGYEPLP